MNCATLIVVTICLWSFYEKCTGDVTCPGNWKVQRDHCYQHVIGAIASEKEAVSKCAALGSGAIPVTVHSDDDNKDLTDFIVAQAIPDTSFYIGLEYKAGTPAGEWDWLDGGNTKTYQLWDHTTDPSGASPCAQINVVKTVQSQWIATSCTEQVQAILCQIPVHSLDSLYQELQQLKAQIGKGSVPVGFIYVQLPGQKAPATLWPKPIVWEDMTKTYAGMFFRAEGNGSAVFNTTGVTTQTASLFTTFNITAKGLSGVSYNPQLTQTRVTPIKEETLSGEIVPGDVVNSLKVLIDDRNAHPVNTAVRIWRRKS